MIVAIVQARTGSSRFPAKVLQDLAGRPVLKHVLQRAQTIDGIDSVCCAIPEGSEDDPVATLAASCNVAVVRGPERDVLERYRLAAEACDADIVMRITSDCPFLDPVTSGLVLSRFIAERPDYCSNVAPRSWPRGLDTEVFSREALDAAAEQAEAPAEREHVTPWIRSNPDYRQANVVRPGRSLAAWRWTLDYPEDLQFMREVLDGLADHQDLADFDRIRTFVELHPELALINAHLD